MQDLHGRRFVVYGASGSGKTTLAREIARRLELPHVELDALFHHRPNWVDATTEEFRARVTAALSEHRDGWVFDGNYSAVRDLILPHADAVIWLRLPFRAVYPRLAWRTLRRLRNREVLWGVNRESFRLTFLSRDSILLWGLTNWRSTVRRTGRDLRAIPHSARIVVLRRRSEVRAFVAGLPDHRRPGA